MTIYQVVDEENNLVCEYQYRGTAIHSAEDMTVWFANHYYHIEEAVTHDFAESV